MSALRIKLRLFPQSHILARNLTTACDCALRRLELILSRFRGVNIDGYTPQFTDLVTDGGEFVSLTRRAAALYPPPPQEDSWYSFLLEAESTPEPECNWKG
jgi:hypothetical protein